ncbi:MAG: hydroxyproline-2-epimerase [Spirochaetaceae bacterium]|nr:MAG: hydroxyproline-2-epimerase [Spirochaetaceae bacterium]
MRAGSTGLQVRIIDSHTAGEPTRVVIEGAPALGGGTVAAQLSVLREQYDWFRSMVVNEPRGSDVLVGALLCPPSSPDATVGVIFFNNIGYLGMCGHATIGVAQTLLHTGAIAPGEHCFETPVGLVGVRVEADGTISFENVPSYRHRSGVAVQVEGITEAVIGDVAWGGNWFFLTADHGQSLDFSQVDRLSNIAWRIRQSLHRDGIVGANGAEIDHIELYGAPESDSNHGRNFVLCPGRAYDRSPCGTGTSAKLACLAADGAWKEADVWRQEGILGTVFEGSFRRLDDSRVIPTVRGKAYVTLEATVFLDPADPFAEGIRL